MDIAAILARCALFANLPAAGLDDLAGACAVHNLRGGEWLFRKGDVSQSLFVLVSGRIRVSAEDGERIGEVGRFEALGEMGLLTGEPRSADARALRDSLLLRIEGARLMQFALSHPEALVAMSRVVIQRMRRPPRQTKLEEARRAHSIAVIAAVPGIDVAGLATRLCGALQGCGAASELITASRVEAELGAGASGSPLEDGAEHERLLDWFDAREQDLRTLVYVAGDDRDASTVNWTARCLRQCDRILLLARSADAPLDSVRMEAIRALAGRAAIELVLLRPANQGAGAVMEWRRLGGAHNHYFLRPDSATDLASLARQISGRGLGLVLGGGGARGFAHLGLIRAMEEVGASIDLVGGTSMGAFFSALRACGLSAREMQAVARETFVEHNYLNDYVLPRVSLIRGRKFLNHLQRLFGDQRIEELRTPFFCVSTNLTRAATVIHESGRLAEWIGTSMAVPGVVPPVVWRGDLLVDGAVTNSLPTDVMQNLGRGPIIASDVSTATGLSAPGIEGPDPEAITRRAKDQPHISLIDILFCGMSLTSESGVRLRASRADLYLRMPVGGVGLFDWKRLDAIVELGYQHAMKALANDRLFQTKAPQTTTPT